MKKEFLLSLIPFVGIRWATEKQLNNVLYTGWFWLSSTIITGTFIIFIFLLDYFNLF